jgi:hypothetical protein
MSLGTYRSTASPRGGLDVEPPQQLFSIPARLEGHIGFRRQPSRSPKSYPLKRPPGRNDATIRCQTAANWVGGQKGAHARVDQVGLGPLRVFEPRDLCFEAACAAGAQPAAPQQPLDCLRLGVDREHPPTAPEQLDAVSPVPQPRSTAKSLPLAPASASKRSSANRSVARACSPAASE